MNKFKSSFKTLAFLWIAVSIASCDKKSEQVNYIPKEANLVLTLDIKSIGVKSLDFKELLSLENIQKTFGSKNEESNQVEKLKNSGIDLLSTAYFFAEVNEENKGYGAIAVALSDPAKFENYVKELDKDFQIVSEGDLKIASKGADKKIIGWNKSSAILVVENSGNVASKEKLLSFFNTQKENSLQEADKNFKDLQNDNSDIKLWVNLEKFGRQASNYSPMGPGMDFKQTFVTANCNFEKGQILINSKYHTNPEAKDKLDLTSGSLGKDIAQAIPANSLVAMFGLSLDMDKIYTYLEKGNYVANAEDIAKQSTGLSTKEIFQMLSGEVAATVNGVEMKEVKGTDWLTGEETWKKEPRPEYAIAIGIKDKDKAARLISKLTEMQLLEKAGNYYSYGKQFFIVDKGSTIIITGSETLRQATLENKAEKLNNELSNLLTDNAGALYLNIKDLPEEFLDYAGKEAKAYIKNSQLEAITITGSPVKNNVSTSKIVIAFTNKEENSLVTLARASEKLPEMDTVTTHTPGLQPEDLRGLDTVSLPK
jgi:hypothetical protein